MKAETNDATLEAQLKVLQCLHLDALFNVHYQRDVRDFTLILIQRCRRNHEEKAAQIVPLASPNEVRQFEQLRYARFGPNVDNFCLHVVDGDVLTCWNKRIIEVFVTEFISQPRYKCKDPDVIRKRFTRHMRYLRQQVLDEEKDTLPQEHRDRQQQINRLARRRRVRFSLSIIIQLLMPLSSSTGGEEHGVSICPGFQNFKRKHLFGGH